ncbi:MAG: type transport system permease protein [Solirubrobacterales bacterium]|nr:type transport system permease protein [Solirubrobacterales bacterium]
MTGVISSELLKLRTARSNVVLAVAGVGLSILIALLTILFDGSPTADVLISDAQICVLFTLILGAMSIAGEVRHGSIAPSLLVTPSRTGLLLGKLVAIVILSALMGALAFGGSLIAGALLLPGQGFELGLSTGQVIRDTASGAAVAALYGVMGLGVGGLIRNQTGAIIVLLITLFFIDPLAASLISKYNEYSLGAVLTSATGAPGQGPSDHPIAQGAALALQLGYSALLFVIGLVALNRADITD